MEESTIAKQNKNVPVLPWMRSPVDVSKFEELKMALQNMGFKTLFPVQLAVWQETIGPGAFERDLCINSPTGSGKTLAYALPIVQMLSTRAVKHLRALVVLPTRDLALQVKQVFAAIAPAVGLSVGLAVGQSSIADEISELIKKPEHEAGICYDPQDVLQELQSSVDILVATPGRLMDHITTTKGFTLEHLCYLVVDETDRMLREAYQSWLPTVLKLTRIYDENLMPGVNNFLPFASGSLKTIRRCGVERGFKGKSYPRLVKMVCASKLKPLYLVAVLQHLGGEKCIVFTSSVESTHRLCTLLNFFGDLKVKIKEYSGLQRQSVRSKTLKAFREGEIQVLVSSDAMTRGMDIEGVRNIINYDMPAYVKTYVHRAGRTARAGQTGRCITLLRVHEVKRFKKLLQKADNDSCPSYSIPSSSVESLHPFYLSALEKLKETVQSETSRKAKVGPKFSRVSKGEKKSLEE
ncbi:ATP-DEPENDENT RNA HELICASE DDX51 [Salix viminalis]|uniref:ATP-dependent RNA helicase n=1 Tax=Salix viminalis TaxID=40686 RepID=A0A9Q0NMI2_SALVM|nr:ATP-DEPENDENT RNA HELICASE DDX51 [Salix viminalis]